MAFTPEQFNVIDEMVEQLTLAQHAAQTPTDPLVSGWNNVAELTLGVCARLPSEATTKNGKTGHSFSKEP